MADTTVRMQGGLVRASRCLGYKVENPEGEALGKIEDLIIDLREGYVAAAILSSGGFLGVGNKLFAIPLSALSFSAAEKKFTLNVDKETLRKAPGFDKDNWPSMGDRLWAADMYSYYGFPPYWE